MLYPAFCCETGNKRSALSAGTARNWQFDQVCGVWFDSAPNQKRVRFHLCLLHFLFLTSSHWNWNWQGNYHFTLNWSQSMWAGSKHGDTRGGKKREKRSSILGEFGDGSVICNTYRLKGGERWKERSREGKRKGRRLEIALRVFPWCPPDRNQIGSRAASALWLFIRLAPPGFSWPEQARFWDAAAHSWSQPVV